MDSYFKSHNGSHIIDLTESFTLATPQYLTNTVIDLDTTNESFNITITSDVDNKNGEVVSHGRRPRKIKRSKKDNNKKTKPEGCKTPIQTKVSKNRQSGGLGECPICCEELGKKRLASTICGHVYCLKCLERSLKVSKTCPTCRRALKRASSYHPLYLN